MPIKGLSSSIFMIEKDPLCRTCQKPLSSADSLQCHLPCLPLLPCSLCGQPALCHSCVVPSCAKGTHRHCLERVFPDKDFSLPRIHCEHHSKRGGRDKEYAKLYLCKQIAQVASFEEGLVAEVKNPHVDPRNAAACSGSVFWFIIGHQFFPSNYAIKKPPQFYVRQQELEPDALWGTG